MTAVDPTSPDFIRAEEAALWCVRLCEGQMTSAARVEFTRWLAQDPRHRTAFDQAVESWNELNAAEATDEVLALRVEALQSFRRAQRTRARWISMVDSASRTVRPSLDRGRWSWILAASVAIVILIGVGAGWHLSPQQVSTGVGERRIVVLADGSSVSLDASSQVLVEYSGAHGTLHLMKGRAKFVVAKDPRRPFLVHAADREIVATGTEFSVELVQKDVRVILYEGRVSVEGPGGLHTLSAGQALVALISSPKVNIAPDDAGRSLSWESGQLEFVDEPLPAAIERVNRYSRNRISLGDAAAASVHISGVFSAGDTRAFIEGATAVAPLTAAERNGQEVLWSSRD